MLLHKSIATAALLSSDQKLLAKRTRTNGSCARMVNSSRQLSRRVPAFKERPIIDVIVARALLERAPGDGLLLVSLRRQLHLAGHALQPVLDVGVLEGLGPLRRVQAYQQLDRRPKPGPGEHHFDALGKSPTHASLMQEPTPGLLQINLAADFAATLGQTRCSQVFARSMQTFEIQSKYEGNFRSVPDYFKIHAQLARRALTAVAATGIGTRMLLQDFTYK